MQEKQVVQRLLGEREMLCRMQRACRAKGGLLTMQDLSLLHQSLLVDEFVQGSLLEQARSARDRDLLQESTGYAFS